MKNFLENSKYINWQHSSIVKLSKEICSQSSGHDECIKLTFEWVRDNIKHSSDFQLNPVTCIASDVLKYKTGYCYAKSHLLAVLLRANLIETGLCYQRLSIEGKGAPYCLHGLNSVKLANGNWYRIDSRGNKEGVDSQFTPPIEKLAFPIVEEKEADFPEIWVQPLPAITDTLESYYTWQDVYNNLPDV